MKRDLAIALAAGVLAFALAYGLIVFLTQGATP